MRIQIYAMKIETVNTKNNKKKKQKQIAFTNRMREHARTTSKLQIRSEIENPLPTIFDFRKVRKCIAHCGQDPVQANPSLYAQN